MWPEPAAAAGSMSAGPPLQLAVLWPWLLMATLRAGLGHTGLTLAAAVETERSAVQKAIIRVIPLKVEPIVLEGEFANVAEVTPAEGKLLQVRAAVFYPAPAAFPSCSYPVPALFSPCSASASSAAHWVVFPGCRSITKATRHFLCERSACVPCTWCSCPAARHAALRQKGL